MAIAQAQTTTISAYITIIGPSGIPTWTKVNFPLNKNSDGSYTLILPSPVVPPPVTAIIDTGPSVTKIDDQTLIIGQGCVLGSVCKARVNGVTYTYTSSATIKIVSGISGALRVYISDGSDNNPPGTWQVAYPGSSGVTCDTNCFVTNGTGQYAGIPLGIYDTIQHLLRDDKAILSTH